MEDDVRVIHWSTYSETSIEPLTMALVGIACALTLILPRRTAILPMVAVAILIPYAQRIVIGGIGFDMMRLVLLCALLRVLSRNEIRELHLIRLDKLFLTWATVMFVVPVLTGIHGLAQQLGFALDNIIEYLLMRCLITDHNSLKPVVRTIVLLSLVVCAGMLIERRIEKNLFYVLGSHMDVTVREGEVRAAAAFDHPILAGTFGAIMFPLMWVLLQGDRRDKSLWIVGMISSVLIVAFSKSSGPLYAFAAGVFAIGLWPFRQHIGTLRKVMWATLILLQLVMSAPVWALFFRIPDSLGLVSGSTSYHRFELIDLAVSHFGEWWLAGISIDEVARWAWGINDITNQFLHIGFSCGLLGIILFVLVLVRGFSMVGQCVRQTPEKDGNPLVTMSAWAIGSLLFVHVMSFMSVGYFSGFWFFLNLSIALIPACCASVETDKSINVPMAEPASAIDGAI